MKIVTEEEILLKQVSNDCERVSSFNSQNCVTNETRLIIVGTITPSDGTKSGYFYTAPHNRIYGYIDEAVHTHLKKKKAQLSENNSDKKAIIDEIKAELIAHKIAFLDVMKWVIRKQGTSADKEILAGSLDCEAFAIVPQGAKIICNSTLAEKYYKEICKGSPCLYLSQRQGKKEDWLKAIRDALES